MAQLVQPQSRPMAGAAAGIALAALVLGGIVGGAVAVRFPSLVQPVAAPAPIAGQGGLPSMWKPPVATAPYVDAGQRARDAFLGGSYADAGQRARFATGAGSPYVNRPDWGGR